MRPAVTVCLVSEAAQGPFVFHGSLEDSCAQARVAGFDAVEIFAPGPEALAEELVAPVLDRHRLKLAAVGTGAGWVVHRLSLVAAEAGTRARAVEFIKGMITAGARFGAPAILGSMQGGVTLEVPRDQAMLWLGDAVEELTAHAHALGTHFLLEPLNRYETVMLRTVADAAKLINWRKAPGCVILADLFHMNIEEVSILEALRDHSHLIGHVHWADSNRRAMGFGHTLEKPILKFLQEIDYEGYCSAEVFPHPDGLSAARQTRKSLRI
ncbi:MAG: sugar phosphate isomerase/epimerase [Planctomycetota bacterium]|nr:sugar phosphate isomerase/epimerase [Planctomycetota bacterium]